MRIFSRAFLLSMLIAIQFQLHGQIADHIPGQVIIQMQPDRVDRAQNFLLSPALADYSMEKALFPELGIYLLSYDPNTSLSTAMKALSQQDDILYVQKNQKISPRNTRPNDDFYLDQWYHNTIQSEEAWDITTGGIDANGRQIVIAVMDSGFDINHEDFEGNIWFNEDEIPFDGIDNDGNGYIDDNIGWNPDRQSDEHNAAGVATVHGTNVAGMAGAKGDNEVGVAGVAWDVKLLFLSGLRSSAEIIEAMRYTSNTRREYNESNGERGAFIVTSSISLGIRNGMAADFPIWCELYNELGENGVLNVAAVDNLDSDVDVNGDIPTTCDSEYLITVTNTDINNRKDLTAAFGRISVDIGAPGTNNVTTSPGNVYNEVSGTSVAAPLVAGTIALLYSAPCEDIAGQSLVDAGNVALTMKSMIYSGVVPSTSLDGITSQGGVLNVFESIQALERNCNNGEEASENSITLIPNIIQQGEQIYIDFRSKDTQGLASIKVFDAKGAMMLERSVDRTYFGSSRINIPYLQSLGTGIYFISLILSDKTTISEKLIIL